MKAYIGPYRSWIGPYQIADVVFFWVDRKTFYSDDDPRNNRWDVVAAETFGEWLASTWVTDFCNWIDKFRTRKVKIQIDPYDTWSLDHTLALITHPMLVQLKKANHGYFSSDPEDVPSIGKGETDELEFNDSKALDRYNWIMDELIWTFDQIAKGDDLPFYDEDTGVYDHAAQQEHDERIKNGLRLFGKYYRALWD